MKTVIASVMLRCAQLRPPPIGWHDARRASQYILFHIFSKVQKSINDSRAKKILKNADEIFSWAKFPISEARLY